MTLSLDPNSDLLVYEDRADVNTSLGRYQEAIRDLQHVASSDPFPLSRYYISIADIYIIMGQSSKAIAALTRALSTRPEDRWSRYEFPQAFFKRAELYRKNGQNDLACSDTNEIARLEDPNSASPVWHRDYTVTVPGWWTSECNLSGSFN